MSKIYRLFPLWIAQLWARIDHSTTPRGGLRQCRTLHQLVRTLHAIERRNIHLHLKQALRLHPDWQAQVRHDLGGYKALKHWENRRARVASRAQSETTLTPQGARITKRNSNRTSRIKTDRYGLFRLASVRRKPLSSAGGVRAHTGGSTQPGCGLKGIGLVSLTPNDLSLQSILIGPKYDRDQLLNHWYKTQEKFTSWTHDLMMLDFALTETKPRASPS